MTDPHGNACIGKPARAIENILVGVACEPLVALGIHVFEIEQDEVGALHQPLKSGEKRLLTYKRLRRRIQASVDAATVRLLEERREEVDLQERFAAGNGDASFPPPIVAIALRPVEQLRHSLKVL